VVIEHGRRGQVAIFSHHCLDLRDPVEDAADLLADRGIGDPGLEGADRLGVGQGCLVGGCCRCASFSASSSFGRGRSKAMPA
jgi:hypothetical protein